MANTVGRFDYNLISDDKIVMKPLVTVCLKTWSTTDGGSPTVTPQMTELEIDTNIELLKADLDTVAKRAKAAIKRANEKQLGRLANPDPA